MADITVQYTGKKIRLTHGGLDGRWLYGVAQSNIIAISDIFRGASSKIRMKLDFTETEEGLCQEMVESQSQKPLGGPMDEITMFNMQDDDAIIEILEEDDEEA